MAYLLGIDIGTTHSKAGLYHTDGTTAKVSKQKTITHYNREGHVYYNPKGLWDTICAAITEVTEEASEEIAVIGITSMAEAGLLIDRKTGTPKTEIIPWFDSRSKKEARFIEKESDPFERFQATGLHNSFKYGLAKLLWLRNQDVDVTREAVWLSVADFIAYKLTGKFGTDYTLAARTFAFDINKKTWDVPWIRNFGFNEDLFPDVKRSGAKLGEVQSNDLMSIGLRKGIPVAVSGHDHVCASLAAGVVKPGKVFDSMGTAETLVGILRSQCLSENEFQSGLSYGCHVLKDRMFWMGGNPNSGGSIEWIRSQLGSEPISYTEILDLLTKVKEGPTGILYFPYLSGSGAPLLNASVKGAFIGLQTSHKREDLLKAVLEGTAFEMECIRKAAERATGVHIDEKAVVGGGTHNSQWLQIKSDVSGCRLIVSEETEATLIGAALTAAIECGIYKEEESISVFPFIKRKEFVPTDSHHESYQRLYKDGYIKLQNAIRSYKIEEQ
ncbi:FGGY-family carbohydrate kinase [Fictibacillus phosphorivorans]|uniref:FGGY-family carbohydrate kinase n=1 Tax=Fictibacillus phosphorivorans TaxID=1221500 RepID=UPI00203FB06F|nr:FGGY family carbohydrate kinase [Fictibacillus phosphorivorans]MCM3717777.1 FGGY family carbohydrate kinase [Fictibacillus phosphorivorans]MCM3777005.1 FGGY family carbohydrate kinase [Fictibacillus phosphorivorans]